MEFGEHGSSAAAPLAAKVAEQLHDGPSVVGVEGSDRFVGRDNIRGHEVRYTRVAPQTQP